MDLSLMNRSKNSGGGGSSSGGGASSELDSYEADIRNSSRLSAFSSSSATDRMLELQHNFIPVAGYHHQQQQQLKSPIPTVQGHFSAQQHHQPHALPPPPPPPPQHHHHHHLFPFTASQWSELEHQALIFKYMMARAPVPPELIIPIRRSLILSATNSAWSGFQMGGSPMDAEPGRCRRTDGKKWRCSRPVVADQKYCDRHMHRGRNRSRKAAQAAAAKAMTAQQSHNSPTTTFQQHPPIPNFEQPADDRSRAHHQPESESYTHHQAVKSLPQADQGQQRKTPEALRHFFDDWPRESKDQTSSEFEASMQSNARRNGLIFPPLKLALDDHDTDDPYTNISLASVPGTNFVRSRHPWFTDTPANPLGGPLAEALQNPGPPASASKSQSQSQSQIKPVGFNLLDSQLSSRKQQQNIVASPTGVLQKIACFSDCSSSASSPGSIRTDNIPHSLAQVE